MNTYWQLSHFVKKVINIALQKNIDFEIDNYSPRYGSFITMRHDENGWFSTKLENGYPVKTYHPELGWFNTQNKYILRFKKSDFKILYPLLKKYHPKLEEGLDSLQKNDLYGFDIFQEIGKFQVASYLAKSSKKFNLIEFNKQKDKWLNAQRSFNKKFPYLFDESTIDKLYKAFSDTEKYLEQTDKTVTVSRISGVSHKISLQPLKPETKTFSKLGNQSYRSVVFIFGLSDYIPHGSFNSDSHASIPKKQNRKDKISTQYALYPQGFNFYAQAGIFEIFEKKPDFKIPTE